MGEKVELLAPAGNYEAFLGAVNAGADAVYLGGERFGARAYADNFKTEEILRALHVAHFYGKKIYLTVNTLLKERELAELSDYLTPLCEAGLDGVIVQDLGALSYMREHFPELSLHASTQMAVTGVRGAALLKKAGVSRIVPARELSLQEVKKIREEAGVEVECFIHGAMCYCYSGQCLFSSILGGRSGNRGRCAQPCRLPYKIIKGKRCIAEEGYPLSLKDMCTLEYLPALIEAGIDSFKIEGRMKRPGYAAGVTAIYRKYIDRYYEEGTAHYQVEKADFDKLKSLYIRSEIQTGYYERHNGKEMITLEKPGYEGCDETMLSEIRETYITEPERMSVRVKANVAVGEPLRIRILSSTEEQMAVKKVCKEKDEKNDLVIEAVGEVVQPAKNAPLTEDEVRRRISKTGESLLTVSECEIVVEGEGFVPVRALNELRREAVKAFEAAVCDARMSNGREVRSAYRGDMRDNMKLNRPSQSTNILPENQTHVRGVIPAIHVLVATLEQLKAAVSFGCGRIYIESDLFIRELEKVLAVLKPPVVCYLALPYILRGRDEAYLMRLKDVLRETGACGIVQGFLVRSLEGLSFALGLCEGTSPEKGAYSLVADAGLYCFNGEAAAFLANYVDEITLPYELNAGEAAHLVQTAKKRGVGVNLIVYSCIPMMITANCLAKTADDCRNHSGESSDTGDDGRFFLKDRKDTLFPVVLNCEHCYNVLYNAVPYSLHAAAKERDRIGAPIHRYDFTTETGETCRQILNGTYAFSEYTAGHCKRGVE